MESLTTIKEMHENELRAVRAERDGFRTDIEKLEEDKRNVKERL
mgnify:CR=1 FL=1|jgi:uncharacterized protein (DUF3084 family)